MRRLAAAALVAVLVPAACGRRSPAPDQRTERRTDASQVCTVTEVVRNYMPDGETFADLVTLPPDEGPVRGAAAAISLLRSRYDADLGPYEPAIRYLERVSEAQLGGKGKLPTSTAAVRSSARALDRDLARGLCDE